MAVKRSSRAGGNEQDVQRFQSEAQAAASLKHPHIVSIHEVGQHEGWHYFSMDYIEGHDLATILRLNLLLRKRATYVVRWRATLAHQQGILHRDLKPSNILIDQQNQIHITDFGLAMRVEADQGLTQTGQILGLRVPPKRQARLASQRVSTRRATMPHVATVPRESKNIESHPRRRRATLNASATRMKQSPKVPGKGTHRR